MPEPIRINVNEAMEKFNDLIGSLLYSNYKYNRERSPQITPEQWGKVYGSKTKGLETLYRLERGKNGNSSR